VSPPAEMEVNRKPPATETGISEFAKLPIPSSPVLSRPQQYAAPSDWRAQVWRYPAEIDANIATEPAGCRTGTGVVLFTCRASPSCPTESKPQQYAAPLWLSPQACSPPAVSEPKPTAEVTSDAVALPPLCPLPSLPKAPLPQQNATLPSEMPHANPSPAVTLVNTKESGTTRSGRRVHGLVPPPRSVSSKHSESVGAASWVDPLAPQQ
jgi:hypothetical protein